MASLCSSRWSDQKCCNTESVLLKPTFQTRPMWALQTHFLARYRFLKWGSKFHNFYKTSKISNDFPWDNPGHGGHEHGVRRGVLGGKLSFYDDVRRGSPLYFAKNRDFWVPTMKVRPPDGIFSASHRWSASATRRQPCPTGRRRWTGRSCLPQSASMWSKRPTEWRLSSQQRRRWGPFRPTWSRSRTSTSWARRPRRSRRGRSQCTRCPRNTRWMPAKKHSRPVLKNKIEDFQQGSTRTQNNAYSESKKHTRNIHGQIALKWRHCLYSLASQST